MDQIGWQRIEFVWVECPPREVVAMVKSWVRHQTSPAESARIIELCEDSWVLCVGSAGAWAVGVGLLVIEYRTLVMVAARGRCAHRRAHRWLAAVASDLQIL